MHLFIIAFIQIYLNIRKVFIVKYDAQEIVNINLVFIALL